MCAADALQEMLLYTENGIMELFPAIPDEWIDGKTAFYKLRGEMGCLVSAVCQNGRITEFELKFLKDAQLFLRKNKYLSNIHLDGPVEEQKNGYIILGKAGESIWYSV